MHECIMQQPHLSQHGVIDGAEVDRAFVGQIIENIEGPGGFRSLLLVAKNQVDPLVKLTGHKLALQSLCEEKREDYEYCKCKQMNTIF